MEKKNSGLGIAAFVISLVGFVTIESLGFFIEIIAIILAIVDLATAKKKNRAIGFSVAGLVIGVSLYVFIFAAMLFMSSSNRNNSTYIQATTAPIAQVTSAPTAAPARIGAPNVLNGVTITVNKVIHSAGTTYQKPFKSGNEFTIVSLTIHNGSSSNLNYSSYDYQIQDSNGNIINTTVPLDYNTDLSVGELAPGGTTKGDITFETPKGDKNLIMIYSDQTVYPASQIKFELQ